MYDSVSDVLAIMWFQFHYLIFSFCRYDVKFIHKVLPASSESDLIQVVTNHQLDVINYLSYFPSQIRGEATSYGVIVFGKIRIPAVSDEEPERVLCMLGLLNLVVALYIFLTCRHYPLPASTATAEVAYFYGQF